MKKVLKESFVILLFFYVVFVALISFNVFDRYTLHFEILAIILSILGIITLKKKGRFAIKEYYIILPLFLVLAVRIIPYLSNNIPLGYDTGIYKYLIEHPFSNETWVKANYEIGFSLISSFLKIIGFSTNAILTWILIFFELLLGIIIYITAKKYFNKEIGFLTLVIYSISITQFKTFTYMYYKNIIALILMLLAFYFLKDKKYIPMILFAALLGGTHRPSYFIFGLTYILYTILNPKQLKTNLINGIIIVVLTIPFYIGRFNEAIIPNIEPIIEANIGAGTFISFIQYQFLSLAYLPFALFGFLYLIKKRDFNVFFLWFLVTGIIVYFKIIFFNRFIIHLDLVMIILAGLGLYMLIVDNKKFGVAVSIILIASSIFVIVNDATHAKPLINQGELDSIKSLESVEYNSFVMSTSSNYSPWILGYSSRKTIAPGLFDYNNWTLKEWNLFWDAKDVSSIKELMNRYQKPLYVFVGKNQIINKEKFSEGCFEKINENIYKWIC